METIGNIGGNNTAERLGLAQLYSKRITPTASWSDMGSSDHFVQFYESDAYIVNSVAEYIIHGLKAGETCIVAATGEHLFEMERIIDSLSTGLDSAKNEGRYIALDAEETLAKFMVNGMPDENLFSNAVTEKVEKAVSYGRRVRVFGEMVGVLARQQNYAAAIRLEDLWNGMRKNNDFSLFCAYPMSELSHSTASQQMTHICNGHSRVIPDETYTSLSTTDERLRAIAVLQQRSRQLQAEVADLEHRIAVKHGVLQPV
ncbi:MAG: MEDS domain-containing protein [Pyrinomonadaceae bacterium]